MSEDLTTAISKLTAEQQNVVREFVEFLQARNDPRSSFRAALDEFVGEHPELLKRLAK